MSNPYPRLAQLAPGDWVTVHARTTPQAPCLVRAEDGTVLTYGEVDRQVTQLAHAMREHGVRKGDRVALLATDSPEYVVVQLACMKLAATIVGINYRFAAGEVGTLLQASRPTALFYGARYQAIVSEAAPAVADQLRFVACLDSASPSEPATTTYHALIDGASSSEEIESVADDEDILVLAFTSGTTGNPKGVLQSQRMTKAGVTMGIVELGIQPDDLLYAGPPLFHTSGMWHVLYGLSRGAASLIMPQFDAPLVLRWMRSGRLTRLMLMTSMVIMLLEQPDVRDSDYTGVRSIMYGGSPMPPSVIKTMAEVFACDLYNGFGAGTEAGAQTMLRPADHRRALNGREELLGSIGRPIHGCDVKICDPQGNEVPVGTIGEIYARSDMMMSGYLDRPDLTKAVFHNGWFHGGDLARRDEDGYLYLAGRADDMIIRGGENIYPFEIEEVLARHPAVAEAAVIGEPHPRLGETVTAVIRLAEGASVTKDELVAHCRAHLAAYKAPHRVVIVDTLPRTSTGKVAKRELQRLVADSAAADRD